MRDFGSWENFSDVAIAGRKAVALINDYFSKDISFNQETTLCGKSILRNVRRAKELQYRVELYFVGLESPDLAKERVRQRVKAGGHGVPEKDIERRYFESLKNLVEIMPLCDHVELYDNTETFRQIATFEFGNCVDKDEQAPLWCSKLISKD